MVEELEESVHYNVSVNSMPIPPLSRPQLSSPWHGQLGKRKLTILNEAALDQEGLATSTVPEKKVWHLDSPSGQTQLKLVTDGGVETLV